MRTPASALGGRAAAPRFSVIIPLEEHRGQAVACVRAWAEQQDFPREQFELVRASPPDNNSDSAARSGYRFGWHLPTSTPAASIRKLAADAEVAALGSRVQSAKRPTRAPGGTISKTVFAERRDRRQEAAGDHRAWPGARPQ
jgi:hypothetical protein